MPIEEKDFHIFELGSNDDFWVHRDLKWITGTKYFFNMSQSFLEHAQLKHWCLENCTGPVAYVEEAFRLPPALYFFNAEDLTAAKLRWADSLA